MKSEDVMTALRRACAIKRAGLLVLDAHRDVTTAGALLQVSSRVYLPRAANSVKHSVVWQGAVIA